MRTFLVSIGLVFVLVANGLGFEGYHLVQTETVGCPAGKVLIVEWWNLEGTDPTNPDRLVFRTAERTILLEITWPPDSPDGQLVNAKEIRLGNRLVSVKELTQTAPTPCSLVTLFSPA